MGYQDSGNRSCAFHSGNYIRCERYAGTLSRSFYVGDSISEEDIHAKYEDGRSCYSKVQILLTGVV